MKIALLAACLTLAGCIDKDAPEDFGARMVADQILFAEISCATAQANDLEDCKFSPVTEARHAAKTAETMVSTFVRICSGDESPYKCDKMLDDAYTAARGK